MIGWMEKNRCSTYIYGAINLGEKSLVMPNHIYLSDDQRILFEIMSDPLMMVEINAGFPVLQKDYENAPYKLYSIVYALDSGIFCTTFGRRGLKLDPQARYLRHHATVH